MHQPESPTAPLDSRRSDTPVSADIPAQPTPRIIPPGLHFHAHSLESTHERLEWIAGVRRVSLNEVAVAEVPPNPASAADRYSPEEQITYLTETAHAVDELSIRLQRCRIAVMSYFLAGIDATSDKSAYVENPAPGTPEHLQRMIWRMKDGDQSLGGPKELLAGLNRYLGPDFQLNVTTLFSSHDAAVCDQLFFRIRGQRDWVTAEQREQARELFDVIRGVEREIKALCREPSLFDLHGSLDDTIVKCWESYREIVKRLALIDEAGSWYSPTYGGSIDRQCGVGQYPEPMRSDYQRFEMPALKDLERRFDRELGAGTRDRERSETILVGGGINALSLISQFIREQWHRRRFDRDLSTPVFSTEPGYFENTPRIEALAADFSVKPTIFRPGQEEKLVSAIKEKAPFVVFLHPLSNDLTQRGFDIRAILEGLKDDQWTDAQRMRFYAEHGVTKRDLYIVIDNTAAAGWAEWQNFKFSSLPKFVNVIAYESLIKYRQDGLEFMQAGAITAFEPSSSSWVGHELTMLRARAGFAIPQATMHRLDRGCCAEDTARRLERIRHNVEKIAHGLSGRLEKDGFIKHVISPCLPGHPDHDTISRTMSGWGGIVTLQPNWTRFLPEYKSLRWYETRTGFRGMTKDIASAYVNLALAMAREVGLRLHVGTSFGFNTSRLAVYEYVMPRREGRDTDFSSRHYIRLSVGSETSRDMKLLEEILLRCNDLFSCAMRAGELNTLKMLASRRDTIQLSSTSPFQKQ